ncbi:MAG: H-NS family nucleoid-associated regulatory protein [Aquabacterium sp.]
MATLSKLMAQRAALEKKISEFQRANRAEGVAKVRALMGEYGLTAADLATRAAAPAPASKKATGKRGPTAGRKVAAKYRDKATGNTWSGRGLQPKWLKQALAGGKKIDDFRI